jgi:hypothetical protein
MKALPAYMFTLVLTPMELATVLAALEVAGARTNMEWHVRPIIDQIRSAPKLLLTVEREEAV